MTKIFSEAGWSKIVKIVPQTITEPVHVGDQVTGEYLWLETFDAVYSAEPLRGETLDGLAAHYQRRGYTDDRATFFKGL